MSPVTPGASPLAAGQRLAMTERDCYLSIMESNGEPTLHPSPEDARSSLEDVRRMEADLADRLVTPWWYYPGLGLVEALFIASMTFPLWLQLPAVVAGVAGLGLLVRNWQRLTGLGLSNHYFALAPGWVTALVVVYLSAIAVVLLADQPVVTAVIAAVLLAATVVLGRRADSAVRYRLRHGARGR
jgi:hypothetical protein